MRVKDDKTIGGRGREDSPERFAEIAGVKMAGQIVGSGPALLLLHGLGGSHVDWWPNLETLAKHFKVYIPTFPGHGASGPAPEYSLETSRRLFAAFLEAEHLDKVILVGQSMGGALALDLALSFPDRVARLVLIDSAGLGREIHWGLRLLSLPVIGEIVLDFLWPRIESFLVRLFRNTVLFCEGAGGGGTAHDNLSRLLRAGVELKGQKLWPIMASRLPTLKAPTLIMWGERDPLFPVSQAYRAHRIVSGSKLHIFPRSGHCPIPDHLSEFNSILLEFLKGTNS